MAEALLNYWGKGRFAAFSAGSHPRGEVHPVAIETLEKNWLPVSGLRSKSWEEFAAPGGPPSPLRVHRLRPRRAGGVPGVARSADDGALGHPGSGRRGGF